MIVAVLGLTLLASCNTAKRHVSVAPRFADDPYWSSIVEKKRDEVFMTDGDLRRSYTVIAVITVESTGTEREISRQRMQSEAAKIGADAVIQIETDAAHAGQYYNAYTGKTGGSKTRHFLRGQAVVYD